ncbi:MAG TPA: hypothetical protein VNT26_22750 [Candidatus Sulfotelmatobacter sp.]|nr:hypothetical protein [Candidatus Sulfotelmatobacter sp.]
MARKLKPQDKRASAKAQAASSPAPVELQEDRFRRTLAEKRDAALCLSPELRECFNEPRPKHPWR